MPGSHQGQGVRSGRVGRTTTLRRFRPLWATALLATLTLLHANATLARPHGPRSTDRNGANGMRLPHTGSLLVDYYEAFLKDHDIEGFRLNVSARYSEGTLCRVVQSGETNSKRAAVLALGVFGTFGSNDAVGKALRDGDPVVRSLAESALWAIWFRADTPENNQKLEAVQEHIVRGDLDRAVEAAGELIKQAPKFAEAYNQRAIAHYKMGHLEKSADDCKMAIKHNPYHIGALSGLGQCEIRLGRRDDAISTFKKAIAVQPHNDGLRELVAELEAGR